MRTVKKINCIGCGSPIQYIAGKRPRSYCNACAKKSYYVRNVCRK